jgi:hypothetical protein
MLLPGSVVAEQWQAVQHFQKFVQQSVSGLQGKTQAKTLVLTCKNATSGRGVKGNESCCHEQPLLSADLQAS